MFSCEAESRSCALHAAGGRAEPDLRLPCGAHIVKKSERQQHSCELQMSRMIAFNTSIRSFQSVFTMVLEGSRGFKDLRVRGRRRQDSAGVDPVWWRHTLDGWRTAGHASLTSFACLESSLKSPTGSKDLGFTTFIS